MRVTYIAHGIPLEEVRGVVAGMDLTTLSGGKYVMVVYTTNEKFKEGHMSLAEEELLSLNMLYSDKGK